MTRPEVVERLMRGIVDDTDSTADERLEAVRHFAASAVAFGLVPPVVARAVEPPSLVEFTYRELRQVRRRAVAVSFLLDRLGPFWASRPDAPLSDVLKSAQAGLIHEVAHVLRQAGIHDLDEIDRAR